MTSFHRARARRTAGAPAQSLALAGLLGLAACVRAAPQGPPQGPPTVGVFVLAARPVPLTAELPGRVSPYEIAEVRPQVQGIIKARLFKEGSLVKAGQALYQIDPATYQAAYDQAKAQVANADANLATTQIKAQRYGDLVKINAVSKQDFDDAEAAYKQALATAAQQRAALESARINLAYTRVTAPISGRIGLSAVTEGALVTTGQTGAMTTIQRLDPIYVDITQSAAEILKLRGLIAGRRGDPAGAPVRLKLPDGSNYPLVGRLGVSDITVDQTTGAVTLRAVFANPEGVLLPGMYVDAEVTEGVDPTGLLAPEQAITRDQRGRPTALVVDARGRAQLRDVQLGQAVGDEWLVLSGLAPGERLIVEGLQKAQPGAAVRAVAADPPPAAGQGD